jgi:hypothetical protein
VYDVVVRLLNACIPKCTLGRLGGRPSLCFSSRMCVLFMISFAYRDFF